MIGRKPLLDVLRALEGDKGDTYPFHLCICEFFFNGISFPFVGKEEIFRSYF